MPLDPDKIRAMLDAKGWSQTELGKRMAMAKPNITRLLAGTFVPKFDTVENLANVLGCSIDKLRTK